MISSLLRGWKISQPPNECSNLLLARAVNQIAQTLISVRLLSMECTDVCKCRGLCVNIIYDSVKSDDDQVEKDNKNDDADNNAQNV